MSESSARPPHPIQCDNCGADIGDISYATVVFFDDGYWGLAHKRCSVSRYARNKASSFDWGMDSVLSEPLRYTMYAMFTTGEEKRTERGVTSWFVAMERLFGYSIFDNEGDVLPSTSPLWVQEGYSDNEPT